MNWDERAIERSEAISKAWTVAKAYAGRIAEIVLFLCLIANLIEMFWSPVWFSTAVLVIQSIMLDVAGFGLTSMAEHARARGNENAANKAARTGWALIGLMIVTVLLVTIKAIFPATVTIIGNIENGLILARVVVTVLYGHIIHSLHASTVTYNHALREAQQEVSRLRAELSTVQQEVSSSRVQVSSVQSEAEKIVSSVQQQLDSKQRELDTLRVQLDSDQAILQTQLAAKQRELESLTKQLESSGERQSGRVSTLQQQLDTEQSASAMLRRQFSALQIEAESLHGQLDTRQRELEGVQSALSSSQSEVSSLRVQLDSLRVSTGQSSTRKLSSGHPQTGQGKVVQLDTGRRRTGQDESDPAEQIRALLLEEPELSGRAIAQRIGCSPTTAAKWKTFFEEQGISAKVANS